MEDYRLIWEDGDGEDAGASLPRVTLAVHDPETERLLMAGLGGGDDRAFSIDRVLDARSLLLRVGERRPLAVVLGESLPGLTREVGRELRRIGLRIVVIATEGPGADEWEAFGARVVDAELRGEARLAAVRHALAGIADAAFVERRDAAVGAETTEGDGDQFGGRVIALFGGKGSPGRTTIATSLATGLSDRWRRVALIDADLAGGDVAVHLGGLHPRSNLFTLAHSLSIGRELDGDRVESELQSWGEGDRLKVLVGLPKPGMAPRISPEVLGSLAFYLRRAYAFSVIDLGPPGPAGVGDVEAAVYRSSDLILVACGADLSAAWHLQHALAALRSKVQGADRKLRLVVNRSGRGAERPESVAEALELSDSLLGEIPEDRPAALRSIERQLPLGCDRGRAGRAIRSLVPKVERELDALVGSVATPAVRAFAADPVAEARTERRRLPSVVLGPNERVVR